MANKILKTLTLPNAQGEPVTYELHPDWDKIDGKPENLDTSWENIEGKPESFPSDLTQASGILPIENGGTGNADGYIRTGALKGTTVGQYATVEGSENQAPGIGAHAEGGLTQAIGIASHAEGANSIAEGANSHAEGGGSHALGAQSHAEGYNTHANQLYSHAEGFETQANGVGSHAEGCGTIATRTASHASGQYNIANDNHLVIVGNGTSNTARSNAYTLDSSGNAWYAGSITATKLILGPESYGTSLPTNGVEGQIFFLIGGSSGVATDDGNGVITLG